MKPVVKSLIIISVSALAIVTGVIFLVILNRGLKKTNDDKRRKIRQTLREEFQKQLIEDLKEIQQEEIKQRIPEVKAQVDVASQNTKPMTEKIQTVIKTREKSEPAPRKIPRQITRKKTQYRNPFIFDVEEIDKVLEELGFTYLLNETEIEYIRQQKPDNMGALVQLLKSLKEDRNRSSVEIPTAHPQIGRVPPMTQMHGSFIEMTNIPNPVFQSMFFGGIPPGVGFPVFEPQMQYMQETQYDPEDSIRVQVLSESDSESENVIPTLPPSMMIN